MGVLRDIKHKIIKTFCFNVYSLGYSKTNVSQEGVGGCNWI